MEDMNYDVVVVGYGYAGAVSAISAARSGANVLLLEKAPIPGGISICSGGGVRMAYDEEAAFRYLTATCADKTPSDVLRRLARGFVDVPDMLKALAKASGATVSIRHLPGDYPLAGSDALALAYIEAVPEFDPQVAYPHVRASSPTSALLFKVLTDNIIQESDRIAVKTGCGVVRLRKKNDSISGVELSGGGTVSARGGVILACGGFEAAKDLQSQYWPGGPALSTAYRYNTGDGLRMSQAVGAGLWHMWHYHGSYGYKLPDPNYPYGIRVKSLPCWRPGDRADLPLMAWILLDGAGRRFMNEYEPYLQDTGHRPLAHFDPAIQEYPRQPTFLVTDEIGRLMYPLGKPTSNDPNIQYEWSADNSKEITSGLFRSAESIDDLAHLMKAPPSTVAESIERWNAACVDRYDAHLGRPASSMHPLHHPPFYVAEVWPIVSNTQGGPIHDEEQRILDAFGTPIPGLYVAGECSSVFGHLYVAGGNLAECFVGGDIAGKNAAMRRQGTTAVHRAVVPGLVRD